MRVLVLNGPNLDLLGTREPEIYGTTTLAELEERIRNWAAALDMEAECLQSNDEAELIRAIHGAAAFEGVILNAGALTHTSRALADAIEGVGVPTVEVHISNIKEREPWRAVSFIEEVSVRTIYGRGINGYHDALRHLLNRSARESRALRYGPHEDNVGDLRLPDGAAEGLVILLHGGFWRHEHQRDITESLAVDLASRGLASWNLEYRRLGAGGGWPGSLHDVVTAIDWIEGREDWSGKPLALVGHSAGGHLALIAAARRRDRVFRVVGLAPVTDLGATASAGGPGAAEAQALLDAGAPSSMELDEKALLVHGAEDEVVPSSHTSRWSNVVSTEILPGTGHFALLDPRREHWARVVSALTGGLG